MNFGSDFGLVSETGSRVALNSVSSAEECDENLKEVGYTNEHGCMTEKKSSQNHPHRCSAIEADLNRIPLKKLSEVQGSCDGFQLYVKDHFSAEHSEVDCLHAKDAKVSNSHDSSKTLEPSQSCTSSGSSTLSFIGAPRLELFAGKGSRSTGISDNKGKLQSSLPSETLTRSYSYLKSCLTLGNFSRNEESSTSVDSKETDIEESVKTKVLTLWNNVKYGWTVNLKTNFSKDSPVYFLGNVYHRYFSDDVCQCNQGRSMERFKQDFWSMFWCTYRKQFPAIKDSNITSDCGWGCMLRCGQMMVAEALKRHLLPKNWVYERNSEDASRIEYLHRKIIMLFGDFPDEKCPFSLHNLLSFSKRFVKKAGDWFGPSSVSYMLKEALESSAEYTQELQKLCIYIAQDCTVYKQDVLELCKFECFGFKDHEPESPNKSCRSGACRNAQNNNLAEGYLSKERKKLDCQCVNRKALLLLVPLRLGGVELNPTYSQCIKGLLSHDLSVGIIGGRRQHSLYFVGFQDDSLLHLDPHFCQETVPVTSVNSFPVSSYHCSSPRKMSVSRMDPSVTLGFYCKSCFDFKRLLSEITEIVTPSTEGYSYPLFEFLEGRRKPDIDFWTRRVSEEEFDAPMYSSDIALLPEDSEEFIII